MTQEREAVASARREAVKSTVDKIRRQLTIIDVNVSPLIDEQEIKEVKEAVAILDSEIGLLGVLVKELAA